jgi:xylulokinase
MTQVRNSGWQDNQPGEKSGHQSIRYVLAIDLGSGGHKAALVTDSGEIVASAAEDITTHFLPNGGVEQDPAEWWNAAIRASKRVISESKVSPEDVVAIACDSQWSVVVPVDQHAEPLMRAIHWMDQRGGPYNRKIAGGFPSFQGYGLFKLLKWVKLTGMAPTHSGVDSLSHVLYIKNELPDIYTKTFKFLEPMDYLTARLTGNITATQKTMPIFMVMDNRQWGSLEYNNELLKLAGVEKEKFPELISNDGIVGTLDPCVADELGLQSKTQVVAGIADSNASIIGSGAVHDYESIIYIGTSQYMTCHVPFKKTDLNSFMTTFPSPFKSRYYLFGEQLTAGQWGVLKSLLINPLSAFVFPEVGRFLMCGLKFMQTFWVCRSIRSMIRSTPRFGGPLFLHWFRWDIAQLTKSRSLSKLSGYSSRMNQTGTYMTGCMPSIGSCLKEIGRFLRH